MRTLRYLAILTALSLLLVGCSKESKDEAAQLEQELSGDSAALVDSTALVDSAVAVIEEETAVVEEEAVEETPIVMPKKPAGDGYTVQVAGCEDRDYANHLIATYKSRGYEPYVTSITVEGQGYYRVRIGIFADLQDAKNLQTELNDKYSIESWIDVTVNSF